MNLEGKVAVITGAGQGIGREIGLSLARQGAVTVLADRVLSSAETSAELVRSATGCASMALGLDVTDEQGIVEGLQVVLETFGKVDILVNNCGVAGPMGPTETLDLVQWRLAELVNVDGMFLMCKHVIPLLRQNGSGSIVNVSSVSAKRPLVERASYCATKAAVIGLTRSLALECGPWGIRVNTVCPGAVDGPRQQSILEHAARVQGKSFEEVAAAKKKASPLNTFVPPAAVGDVIAFLCSPAAAMMTGQDINVSAGAWMC